MLGCICRHRNTDPEGQHVGDRLDRKSAIVIMKFKRSRVATPGASIKCLKSAVQRRRSLCKLAIPTGGNNEGGCVAQYIPSPRDWVREQVELYARTNGAQGNTLRSTALPVIIVTNIGNKTGAIRKTIQMEQT
ncbi:MAG: nitroreductase/quinone reductase family protein [Burkholderiales bacterium]